MRGLGRFGTELRGGEFGIDAHGARERFDEADRIGKRGKAVVRVLLDRGEVAQGDARVARDIGNAELCLRARGGKRCPQAGAGFYGVARRRHFIVHAVSFAHLGKSAAEKRPHR